MVYKNHSNFPRIFDSITVTNMDLTLFMQRIFSMLLRNSTSINVHTSVKSELDTRPPVGRSWYCQAAINTHGKSLLYLKDQLNLQPIYTHHFCNFPMILSSSTVSRVCGLKITMRRNWWVSRSLCWTGAIHLKLTSDWQLDKSLVYKVRPLSVRRQNGIVWHQGCPYLQPPWKHRQIHMFLC